MTSDKRRQQHRERRELGRRRLRRVQRVAVEPTERSDADQKRQDWKKKQAKRRTAYALMVLALVVAVSHLLEHLDVIQILPNPAAQDLLLGYPTAGILLVIGLILLPADKY